MFVFRCLMFVGCSLFVVRGSSFVVCSLCYIYRCSLVVVRWWLCECSLFVACCVSLCWFVVCIMCRLWLVVCWIVLGPRYMSCVC